MLVIPALDLRRGHCVRLHQGNPDRETVYSGDPVATALRWEELGAPMLHVVDLDGAFTGQGGNTSVIAAIAGAVKIPVQLGGGLRSREAVEQAFLRGVSQVVLGTMAVERPGEARRLAEDYGERVLVGIDARDGLVAVKGWTEASALSARELARRVEQWGVAEIVYTDIRRDGTLLGPNLAGLEELLEATSLKVILSGGISSREDLAALKPYAGRVRGVIIGKALYDHRLTLAEAVAALR